MWKRKISLVRFFSYDKGNTPISGPHTNETAAIRGARKGSTKKRRQNKAKEDNSTVKESVDHVSGSVGGPAAAREDEDWSSESGDEGDPISAQDEREDLKPDEVDETLDNA